MHTPTRPTPGRGGPRRPLSERCSLRAQGPGAERDTQVNTAWLDRPEDAGGGSCGFGGRRAPSSGRRGAGGSQDSRLEPKPEQAPPGLALLLGGGGAEHTARYLLSASTPPSALNWKSRGAHQVGRIATPPHLALSPHGRH